MFSHKSRWLPHQAASFSAGINLKLIMDSQRETSRILDRTIARMARVQEEKERRRQTREQGEASEDEKKKKKEEEYERSSIARKLSVLGSYRKLQIKRPATVKEVSTVYYTKHISIYCNSFCLHSSGFANRGFGKQSVILTL